MARIPVRSKRTGRTFLMQPQQARALIARGKGQYEDASPPPPPPPPPDGLDEMPYQDLRALVRERDLEPESLRRSDLVDALRYRHRAMTAAD